MTSWAVASGDAGFVQGVPPDGMAQTGTQRDDQLQGAGDAQDDADPVAIE